MSTRRGGRPNSPATIATWTSWQWRTQAGSRDPRRPRQARRQGVDRRAAGCARAGRRAAGSRLRRAGAPPPGPAAVPRRHRRRHGSGEPRRDRCAAAEGAGVDGLLLPRHRAVHVTPTVAKASAGAVEHVPIALVPGLPTTLSRLRDRHLGDRSRRRRRAQACSNAGDLAAEAVCMVLGAEGSGMSCLVRERCDMVVSIPMRGRYRLAQRRRGGGPGDLRDRTPPPPPLAVLGHDVGDSVDA